jgi:hypothetical protein
MILNRKFLKFEIGLDFVLIAVTSPVKVYRICYLINKSLKFNFIKINDLVIDVQKNNSPAAFPLYNYYWEAAETDLYFIANKCPEGCLIPEMRNTDYFLLIRNHFSAMDTKALVSSLNNIPEILSAVKIDPKRIKSRENLLF